MSDARHPVVVVVLLGALLGILGCDLLGGGKEERETPHPGCPGASSRSATSATDCSCINDQVLVAGRLECESCDPVASKGVYCDCGENSIFSFDGRLEQDLGLYSQQVQCQDPSSCGDGPAESDSGSAEGGNAGAAGGSGADTACEACEPFECGVGCDPCLVGETCVSGVCVYAGACRLVASRFDLIFDQYGYALTDASGQYLVEEGNRTACPRDRELAFFDYLSPELHIGSLCLEAQYVDDENGYCEYVGIVEALSK